MLNVFTKEEERLGRSKKRISIEEKKTFRGNFFLGRSCRILYVFLVADGDKATHLYLLLGIRTPHIYIKKNLFASSEGGDVQLYLMWREEEIMIFLYIEISMGTRRVLALLQLFFVCVCERCYLPLLRARRC